MDDSAELAPARRHIIERPRLIRLLDEATARIILLAAPAGYGKTTLARQWLEQTGVDAAWYSATASAHDVASFAAGLAAALGRGSTAVGERTVSRLRGMRDPAQDVDALAELLAEDIEAAGGPALLVIDDYHHAFSPESDRFLQVLMSRSSLTLLAASRHRPAWATPRRILYGEVAEIGAAALALTREEAACVLSSRSIAAAPGLLALADGWPAVIGLIALSGGLDVGDGEVGGPLYDYIAEELFQLASPETQSELCRLAISELPSAALLQRLAGPRAAEVNAEAVKLGLWRVTSDGALDLHPLLLSFLRGKLSSHSEELVSATATTAIGFHAERQEWDEAVGIALSFTAPETAVEVFGESIDDLLSSGRLATVKRVSELLGQRLSHPTIDLAQAELAFRHGEYRRAEAVARRAAATFPSEHRLASRAHRVAGDAALFQDDREAALSHYTSAREVATTERDTRQALWGVFVSDDTSDPRRAARALAEYEAAGSLADADHSLRSAQGTLMTAIRRGSLDGALRAVEEVTYIVAQARDPFARTAFRSDLATALILTADYARALKVAAEELDEVIALKLTFARTYAWGHIAAARLGRRQFRSAARALREADRDAHSSEDRHARLNNASIRARLALAQGDVEHALTTLQPEPHTSVFPGMISEYLALRGLALICGDQPAGARHALEEAAGVSSSAEASVLICAVEAIAALKRDPSKAKQKVSALWEDIERTNNRDSFIASYRAFPPLLEAAAKQDLLGLTTIVRKGNDLRLAAQLDISIPETPGASLTRLTKREVEVLALLTQGFTNRQIADAFVISESTVKVHVRHILKKLDVHSRTAAAIRAADAGLLSADGSDGSGGPI